LKILHVIPSVAARYGGPSTAIAPMCRSLVERGVEVLLATTDADGRLRLPVPIGERTTWMGVPAIFFSRDCSEAYKYSRGLAAWLTGRVADFDVVHIHAVLSHAPLAAAAACRAAGVPYVVRPLGTIDPWSLRQKPLRKKLLLALGGHRMLRGAAAIHYTSAEEQRLAEGTLGLANGVVIPLGIDEALVTAPLVAAEERQRDPYVLVLARLHQVKNLEPFIEAFAMLTGENARYRDWRLVIAGSGEPGYVSGLERLVAGLGAQQRIVFSGWAEGSSKHDLIAHASLFALPSLHENFGLSLVEALASGVPALVSRHVHLADAVAAAGAGWVVDSDALSLKGGLAEALGAESARVSRGRAARDMARTFAWPAISADLVALYRRLLAAATPGVAPIASGAVRINVQ